MNEQKVLPVFDSNAVPLVACFDNNYCLSGAALISSIVQHASPNRNYDLVIMEQGITDENKSRLIDLAHGQKNISIRFFNINSIGELAQAFTRTYFSPIVYGRLFIPKIFSEYKKIIYIDSDMIVQSDVAELLKYDLQNNLIAAVKDLVMEGYVKFKVRSAPECGGHVAGKYIRDYLKINQYENYFQAGLLILDIEKILIEKKDQELTSKIGTQPLWFLDQDILNMVFQNRVLLLPIAWNVYHGNGNTNGFFPKLDKQSYNAYLNARKEVKIIHFAGDQKPWVNRNVDFYEEFYNTIKDTSWENDLEHNLKNVNFKKKIKGQLTPIMSILFPLGSNRRIWIRDFYDKLSSTK